MKERRGQKIDSFCWLIFFGLFLFLISHAFFFLATNVFNLIIYLNNFYLIFSSYFTLPTLYCEKYLKISIQFCCSAYYALTYTIDFTFSLVLINQMTAIILFSFILLTFLTLLFWSTRRCWLAWQYTFFVWTKEDGSDWWIIQ